MARTALIRVSALAIGAVTIVGCAGGDTAENQDTTVSALTTPALTASTPTTETTTTAPDEPASPRLAATTRLAITDCLDKATTFGTTAIAFPSNFDNLVQYCRDALAAVESDGPWARGTAGDQLLELLLARITAAELMYDAVVTGDSSKLDPSLVFDDGRPNPLAFDDQHEQWAADVTALVQQID